MAVELLEPALCYLHEKFIVFVLFVQSGMMILTEISPKSELLGTSAVRCSMHKMMLMHCFALSVRRFIISAFLFCLEPA